LNLSANCGEIDPLGSLSRELDAGYGVPLYGSARRLFMSAGAATMAPRADRPPSPTVAIGKQRKRVMVRNRILFGAAAAGLAVSLAGCAPVGYAGYGYAPVYAGDYYGGYVAPVYAGGYYGGGYYGGGYYRHAYYGAYRHGVYYRGGYAHAYHSGAYRAGGYHGGVWRR
jgi:hypothetical protein